MPDLAIGIVGAAGRMGLALARAVAETKGCRLAAACEVPLHEAVGADLGTLAGVGEAGVVIGAEAAAVFAASGAVLDFTAPDATAAHAVLAAEAGTALITGTTGLEPAQQEAVARAARKVAVVQAPNFSVGVNLAFALVEEAARILDESYDVEIVEMHHNQKADAPSGTALGLGRAAARGRGADLDQMAVRGRDGITGPRKPGAIGFASLRGGDVVGEHTAIFAGPAERLEITHRAGGREIFARGALRAALWTQGKPPGLYSMADVLGFSG